MYQDNAQTKIEYSAIEYIEHFVLNVGPYF